MDIIKGVTGGNCMSSYLNPGNLQQDKMFVCHFD